MNATAKTTATPTRDGMAMLADQQMIVPAANHNRPGTKSAAELGSWPALMRGGWADEIVVHDTANTSPGADALMHGGFLRNGGGPETVSFHAGVDDKRVVQYLPWNETCYAAGDGLGVGNTDSINIEMCINRDGNFQVMLSRAAAFIARLMHYFDIPITKVRQHNFRSSFGKDCPATLRDVPGAWDRFISAIMAAYNAQSPAPIPPPVPGPIVFPETGVTVAPDFYAFWGAHGGVSIFGYPIKPEIDTLIYNGALIPSQSFERARFERHPDGVKLGLVEVERLRLLGE